MEKAVRDTASQDTALDAEAPTHAPGGGAGGDAAAGGPSDGSTAKAPAGPALHDGGWEADYSLLAAMGIVVGQPKPQAPKHAEGGAGGGAAKPAHAKVPGVHTPPKAGPQGKVTPEIKKDLQAKKDHKAAAGGAGGAGAGGAGAAAAGPAGSANAAMNDGPAKAGSAVAAPAAGATAAAAGDAPSDGAPKPPGSHTGDDIDDLNVERLIGLLEHDTDPEHRRAAVRALGKIKSPKARAALEKALRDKDPQIVKAATESLKGAQT